MDTEPILDRQGTARYTFFPIKHPELYRLYQQAVASFWTVDEIDLETDTRHWQTLNADERHFISHVLAFFAASDGLVSENLVLNFANEVTVPEARAFYGFQNMIEQVHSETYSQLIEALIHSPTKKEQLFNAIEEFPAIRRKAEWAMSWMDPAKHSFAERLVAFICVEGIFFSGSFCAIYWLKKRGLMPGLTFSNELISRDEALHCTFAVALHHKLLAPCSEETTLKIFKEAVEIEKSFVTESLPSSLLGMNDALMAEYIEFVADYWLQTLRYDKTYHTKNPFDWMTLISLQGKTNFFEKKVGEYAKAGVMSADKKKAHTFTMEDDF